MVSLQGGWKPCRGEGNGLLSHTPPPPACAVRGLLAGRVPPEGPWELQGIELLSQNDLYRQILLLLHLLPRDLLLLQVRPSHPQPGAVLGLPFLGVGGGLCLPSLWLC